MKVAIAAGGRFHAFHLAHQLAKRNSLKRLFTFCYTKQDKSYVTPALVTNDRFCGTLNYAYSKLRLYKVLPPSKFNIFKDNCFDNFVRKEIKNLGTLDIFVGWGHYVKNSIPEIKKTGAKLIIESGSCHIKTQQELLQEEYKKWELHYPPISQKNIDKMVTEYQAADYIMTLSEFSRQSFIDQGIKSEKLLKVPCGCDVEYFLKTHDTENNLHKQNIKQKKFTVIFVGLLSLRKGIQYLLQAWNKLNLPEHNTQLLLVGTLHKDLKTVLSKIKIKNNVVFFGSTNRQTLRKLYHDASVFVLPSVEDGFGMVMGEAMASRLPVICSSHTGGTEIIKNGQEGFIVPAYGSKALAEKISWCYEHPEKSQAMGALGQQKILNFSWDIYGQQVYETYQKLV